MPIFADWHLLWGRNSKWVFYICIPIKIISFKSKQIKKNIHQNTNIKTANKMPAKTKYMPFLNIVVLGRNIQKEEITKKKRDIPKNIFK